MKKKKVRKKKKNRNIYTCENWFNKKQKEITKIKKIVRKVEYIFNVFHHKRVWWVVWDPYGAIVRKED